MTTQDPLESFAKGATSGAIGGVAELLAKLKPNRRKKVNPYAPPSPDPDFVGREGKIKEVVDLLLQGNKGVCLHGNPGIGKSEIAKK